MEIHLTEGELALTALIVVSVLIWFTIMAFRAPGRLVDALNALKVILLALIGKKRSERRLKGKDRTGGDSN